MSSYAAPDAGTRNPLRTAVAGRAVTAGPWVTISDPAAVEVLAQTALDYLVFDCQHGPHDLGTVLPLLRAAAIHGMPALLRVASSAPWMIMRALDLGAAGVIVPMVGSAAEAARACAATRYPPLGERSFGALRPAAGDVFDPADGPLVLPMIETAEGLAAVDAIAATPGVDGLFVGPLDLALSIGATPGADPLAALSSPDLRAAIDTIGRAATAHGKLLAGAVFSTDHARTMAKAGMTMQVRGTDLQWLAANAASAAAFTAELAAERGRSG